jgi:DNA-binding NtrC family response regulator
MPLIDFFLKKFSVLNGIKVKGFSKEALEAIHDYSWPGNVRELENAVERAVILCGPEGVIMPEDLPDFGFGQLRQSKQDNSSITVESIQAEAGKIMTIDELVKKYIKFVLEKNQGLKDKTAVELNIDRKTLYRKLKEMEYERH